jgi:hypothetical protein
MLIFLKNFGQKYSDDSVLITIILIPVHNILFNFQRKPQRYILDWPVLEVILEKCMSLPIFNIWVP